MLESKIIGFAVNFKGRQASMVDGLIKEPDVEEFKAIIHLVPLDLETAKKLCEMTEEALYKHPELKKCFVIK